MLRGIRNSLRKAWRAVRYLCGIICPLGEHSWLEWSDRVRVCRKCGTRMQRSLQYGWVITHGPTQVRPRPIFNRKVEHGHHWSSVGTDA